MIQQSLNFVRPKARRTDPSTSHLAAIKMEGKARKQNDICEAEVRRKPGQTAAEIGEACNLERHVPSRRLPGLRDAGKVLNWHWNSEWQFADGIKAREKFTRKCEVTGSKSMTWWPSYEN